MVAEDDERVIGAIQIKTHRDGSRDLASLVVIPEYRCKGAGSTLAGAALAAERGPVYLTCAGRLKGYYARFGFRRLEGPEMLPSCRRLSRLMRALEVILRVFG